MSSTRSSGYEDDFAERLGDPLSWKQARYRLRRVLQNYVKAPPPARRTRDVHVPSSSDSILSTWINKHFDLYFGALSVSVALLVVSCLSLSARYGSSVGSQLEPSASKGLYKSQVIASFLLVCGACASLWMTRRLGFLSLNDTDNSKRREVFRFLRALTKHEENGHDGSNQLPHRIHLGETSLNGIYPVYRKSDSGVGSWCRVPNLLLVRGDYIALQIGDNIPAACVMMNKDKPTTFKVNAGERLSLELIGQSASEVMADLPKGRSTIAPQSEHLLTVCNRMRVFMVLQAPIEEFILRPSGRLGTFCTLVNHIST